MSEEHSKTKHPLLDETVTQTALLFWRKNNEAAYTLWASQTRSTPKEKEQGVQEALGAIRSLQSEYRLPSDREMEEVAAIFLTSPLTNQADLTKQIQIYVNHWKPPRE